MGGEGLINLGQLQKGLLPFRVTGSMADEQQGQGRRRKLPNRTGRGKTEDIQHKKLRSL
jgi:hypothetical protein